jgi:hypothetical protein
MSVSSGLRSAVKNSSQAVLDSLQRARSAFSNIKFVPSRVGSGTRNTLETAFRKGDPTAIAKSTDDATDTAKALDDVTSHPLGKGPGETPKTSVKGEAPPAKDPATDMPDGPPKVNARWAQISPYVKGGGGTAVLVGIGVGTFMAIAGVRVQNTDGVEVKITKIERDSSNSKLYKFTYTTQGGQMCGPTGAQVPCIQNSFNPYKDDTFTFRNTYTNPNLNDVTALVVDVSEDAVYFELDLTAMGTGTPEWGFMTCHSSFRNQFRGVVRDTVQFAADVAVDIIAPVTGGLCDAVPIPFVCDGVEIGGWATWVCLLLLLFCCAVGLFLVLS